jgi:formylglycine-generating enzyme required for sulfatase activity
MERIRKLKFQILVATLVLGVALSTSCTREWVMENGTLPTEDERVEVAFSADANPGTRTSVDGNQWLTTDEMGIFMVTSGQTLSTAAISEGADNRKYQPQTASTSSTLAPAEAGQTIYFPSSGAVDFIAYYPWKASGSAAGQINNYLYPIDLTDQSNPAALDLLYAKKLDRGKSLSTVNLAFAHQLSKITLHVKKGADISSVNFGSATATISGMPATAAFSLADATFSPGATVNFQARKADTAPTFDATFDALLVPQAAGSGRKVSFTADGNTYEWLIPATDVFETGKNHIYTLTIYASGAEDESVVVAAIGAISTWTNVDHSTIREMEKVLIHAGTFLMGSPEIPNNILSDGPYYAEQHQVTLTQDFYISKYEVTNAQYAAFLNALDVAGVFEGGSLRVGKYNGRPLVSEHTWGVYWNTAENQWKPSDSYSDYPVVNVTWYGADEYARWAGGSLPTEAQWEYACRAGTTTPFGVGDGNSLYTDQANFSGRYDTINVVTKSDYSGYDGHPNTFLEHTVPVGSYPPNAWGLYDMHGNVAEWCNDWYIDYGSGTLPVPAATDPTGPASGSYRLARGGGYNNNAPHCASAYRYTHSNYYYYYPYPSYSYQYSCYPYHPDTYSDNLGFRVAFPVE